MIIQRHRKLILGLAVVLALSALAAIVLFKSQLPPRPPLPNPNGYDDFTKAGELATLSVGSFAELNRDALNAMLAENAESLRLLRTGLTRKCAMPVESALTNINLNKLSDLKRLAQLLAAEGRLMELDNRPAAAAQSYIDAIRFGNEMSRNGFLITRLVGMACEAIGCRAFAQVVPKLGSEDVRGFIGELEKVDATRVTWDETLKNEKYYMHFQMRNRFNPFLHAISWWQSRSSFQKSETVNKMLLAHERLLLGELALRRLRSEQGRPPAALDELVTNYVSKVPQDPFTGKPLIYRPNGTNWLLYSVGPDLIDDGGKPAAKATPSKGDILYNSTW
jgi:hypothetical protein